MPAPAPAEEKGRYAGKGGLSDRMSGKKAQKKRGRPRFFRPLEPYALVGDSSKAKKALGWEPRISFKEMIQEMVSHELDRLQKAKRAESFSIKA